MKMIQNYRSRLILAAAISLLCLGTASADGHGGIKGHGPRAGNVDRMVKHLQLSDQQAVAVQEIFARQRKVMEAAHADGRKPTKEERQAHRAAMDTALADVLTEQQMERFTQMRGRGQGIGQGKGMGHGAGQRKAKTVQNDESGQQEG